ncbi:hypothetical protein CgunFtcFv8_009496 [Champsocephalus gunnari]|uniref:Uncharacterized protein n=1 Tax=Champsocephalus gunnari TaxID=52237 RepID=A0AAN8H1G2_CHAGU|nr:hypothetical protein CgunFtcFv8_009496 [Champsocephalus gunnari]
MIPDGAWCPAERGAECVWRVRVLRVLQCVSFPRSVRRSARRSLSQERQQSGVVTAAAPPLLHSYLAFKGTLQQLSHGWSPQPAPYTGREGPNMRVQEEPPRGLFEGVQDQD